MKHEHYLIILQAIEDPEPLNEWEYDFIDNLAEKDEVEDLSERQIEVLLKIGDKY